MKTANVKSPRSTSDSLASKGQPVTSGTPAGPPRLRRRPVLIAASVAAICLGALLAVWVWMSATSSVEVLAARATIHRGEVVDAADLMAVRVTLDPAMRAMPASQLDEVVGRVASLDVAAGGLLSEDTVQPVVTPGKGVSVVGVSLSSGLLPAIGLQAGDRVRIVRTPGAQGEPSDKPAWSMDAQVVSVTPAADGQASVVDVLVPSGSAADLASLAATGKVALVLDSRVR